MSVILLVEDVEDNRGIIRQLANRMQLDLLEAADGAAGVQMAKEHHPDLILMDLGLPVMDGWMAATLLKADSGTAKIPIIALTSHAMSGDEAKAREAGCDHYVTKPIDLMALRSLLERCLASVHP